VSDITVDFYLPSFLSGSENLAPEMPERPQMRYAVCNEVGMQSMYNGTEKFGLPTSRQRLLFEWKRHDKKSPACDYNQCSHCSVRLDIHSGARVPGRPLSKSKCM
jgi:hypothetical protein